MHTQPGWPTGHCPAVCVQQALGFGYSSETELKALLPPADPYSRDSNILCPRGQRNGVGPRELCTPFSKGRAICHCPSTLREVLGDK